MYLPLNLHLSAKSVQCIQLITSRTMAMQTLTSREVQKNFGAISDKVVREGETMTITKYGRPSMYIMPVNEETADLIRKMNGRRLIQKMRSRTPNPEAEKLTQEDINKLIHDCFA